MTLTELRYLVALERERHFGRAADACFVSQPTLSVAIRKLEEELNVTLFERTNTDISVTPLGQRIVAQATQVLEHVQTLKQIAHHGEDTLAGPLRLGAIYTVAPYLLPKLIPALHAIAPSMPLLLEENFTHKLVERLRQGELDAILVALPFNEPGLHAQTLYREPFQVMIPAAHAWSAQTHISIEALAQENTFLLGSGHCFREQVLGACPALSRSMADGGAAQTLQSGSLETIRYMVASGAGISVMPCTATQEITMPGLDYRPFSAPVPFRDVALASRSTYPRQSALQALVQAVAQCRLACVATTHDLAGTNVL